MTPTVQHHEGALVVTLPLRTTNPLNGSQSGWRAKARIRKRQRAFVALVMRPHAAGLALPLSIAVTRIAPRSLDAWDGLGASLKAVIDGVADVLGIRDDDKRVTWQVEQRRGRPNEYAVEVSVCPWQQAKSTPCATVRQDSIPSPSPLSNS